MTLILTHTAYLIKIIIALQLKQAPICLVSCVHVRCAHSFNDKSDPIGYTIYKIERYLIRLIIERMCTCM